jgi:hypothetical protein
MLKTAQSPPLPDDANMPLKEKSELDEKLAK